MARKKQEKPDTRVVAVFDSETVNYDDAQVSLPVCYQLGMSNWAPVEELTEECISTEIYRVIAPVYTAFDNIAAMGRSAGVVPVVAVHNLAYDIHFLMNYFADKATNGCKVECCFKSSIKPLSVTISDDAGALIIFWDTLTFSGKSLAKMGRECGCLKATGDWDYEKTRTAVTPLTEQERFYATQDVIVPFMWLKWWAALNKDVPTNDFGRGILTKTSVVRYKCKTMGGEEYYRVNNGKRKMSLYRGYMRVCANQLPKTPEDYALMVRSTSAGWTFTASNAAGATWHNVRKYDAASMHPSHMVSHRYPLDFEMVSNRDNAQMIFNRCIETPLNKVLDQWTRPFDYAFNARVRFANIRPKAGTVYERDGVMLHGSALFADYAPSFADLDDEASADEFNRINADGYANIAVNPVYSFGKLVTADEIIVSLNELNAWVHSRVYDWDDCEVLSMSASGRFLAPPDYVVMAVTAMLERKKCVKDAMHGAMPDGCPEWMPEHVYALLAAGETDKTNETVKAFYQSVKADLNSLYGMFATNEARRSVEYFEDEGDFRYTDAAGFEKLPENPKAWYNFGLRIAAWSRVQQTVAMELMDGCGYVQTLINGDTDSFAFECVEGVTDEDIAAALRPLHTSIERGKTIITNRYAPGSALYSGLGLYEVDCEPIEYCAVANKRYAYTSDDGGEVNIHTASAGVPVASVRMAVTYELDNGAGFSEAVIKAAGYYACYVGDASGTKYKRSPAFCDRLVHPVTVKDYTGLKYTYPAGSQVGIYLRETDKALGAGFDDDYATCCANAGIGSTPAPRAYEIIRPADTAKKPYIHSFIGF